MMGTLRRAAAFVLCALAFGAQAQSLSNAQLATLKGCIDAVPEWSAMPNNSDTATTIAAGLNVNASPTWTVWRTAVTRDDVTVEGFDWTQVDNLTTGQARIWDLLFQTQTQTVNFGESGKRAAISETWKGTAAKVAVGVFVLNQAKRSATVGEKCLSTGTGSQGSPATIPRDFSFNYQDVQAARSL